MKRLALLLALAFAQLAHAQVAVDSTTATDYAFPGPSTTIPSFAAGATADCVVVAIGGRSGGAPGTVTYAGGAALTAGVLITSPNDPATHARIFYSCPGAASLPDSGAVVITAASGDLGNGNACVLSLSSVDTATPVTSEVTNVDQFAPSVTVTGIDSDSLVISSFADSQDLTTLTAGPNQTVPTGCSNGTFGSGSGISSWQAGVNGGVMSYTVSPTEQWNVQVGIGFLVGGAPPPPSITPAFIRIVGIVQ